jgi:RHS repeat-associated protein
MDSTVRASSTETGLDYFNARYFWATLGRFTSPDAPFADQYPEDPQSWNLYSYVRNNPLIYTDPSGNGCVYLNSSATDIGSVDDQITSEQCGKTGGYWVDGTVTEARFAHGSLTLAGTTDGQNRTSASYGLGPDPGLVALQMGMQRARPGVELAGHGLMVFGSFAAPLPMAITQYGAGNGSEADIALAMIPGGGGLKLGGKLLKIDPSKPLRTYLAGARLAKGEGFPEHLLEMTGKQLKEAVDKGLVTPDHVRKIAKVVEQGQRLMRKLGGK